MENCCCTHIHNVKSSITPASTVTLKIMKISGTLIIMFLHLELELESVMVGRKCVVSLVWTEVIAMWFL